MPDRPRFSMVRQAGAVERAFARAVVLRPAELLDELIQLPVPAGVAAAARAERLRCSLRHELGARP
eukprot:2245877-Lingulodinium_polyedra.AAC.1